MPIEKTTLGEAIRKVRKLRGLSQAKLAEQAGIQPNSIALIERGERGVSMETLNEISAALEIPSACLTILGSKQIAGSKKSAALVEGLQKLISATLLTQITKRTEEEAEQAKQDRLSEALDSIPEIGEILLQLGEKPKRKAKVAS